MQPAPSWSPLTTEIENKSSPVRQFFDQRFPHMRDLQRRYPQQVGRIMVPDDPTVNPGTLGGAFDWLIRFLVNPEPELQLALNPRIGACLAVAATRSTTGTAAVTASPRPRPPEVVSAELRMAGAMAGLAKLLRVPRISLNSTEAFTVYTGPRQPSQVEPVLLARACWSLALLTEVYRRGLMPGSPLLTLDHRNVRAEDLLALAPDAALEQLTLLRHVAEDALLPALRKRPGPWALGPIFDGSEIMNADADVVAAGLLLEIKTTVGRGLKDGSRQAQLKGETLRQLLGYLLLDFSDRFQITVLGLYSARYGHLALWDVRQLLRDLAGHPVDLAAERVAFKEVLLAELGS